MDITEVRDQPLSSLFTSFYRCDACDVVDRDGGRVQKGHPCSRCGSPSTTGAGLHFGISVFALIDLMQEAYHRVRPASEAGWSYAWHDSEKDHQLGVVIYYTTLGEVLLDQLFTNKIRQLGLPKSVAGRLLSDHQTMLARVDKLFPALMAAKWRETIRIISQRTGLDFQDPVTFYLKARRARNLFLHEGNKWAVSSDMPGACLKNIQPLLTLFMELHNQFCLHAA